MDIQADISRRAKAGDSAQEEMERMILEGLDDNSNGSVHRTNEVRRKIASWKRLSNKLLLHRLFSKMGNFGGCLLHAGRKTEYNHVDRT
jgi:hypothetical protein